MNFRNFIGSELRAELCKLITRVRRKIFGPLHITDPRHRDYHVSVSVVLFLFELQQPRSNTLVHVLVDVDLVWQVRDFDLELGLYIREHVSVLLVRDEGNGQALGAEAARAAHPVQVLLLGHWAAFLRRREVVVDDDVDALDVHAAAHEVRGHQDALLELLEVVILLQTAKK